jgi:ferredoxin-NADP reductase
LSISRPVSNILTDRTVDIDLEERAIPREPDELVLRISRVDTAALDVVSLCLVDPRGAPLPRWDPGAHVAVAVDGGAERQYSLCGPPADRGLWRIAVLRDPYRRGGSHWMHDAVTVGDHLRVRGPRNDFRLVEADAYVLIAGGIGITPLLPMVGRLAAGGATWSLLYGGRTRASMAFVDELQRFGDRVTIWPEDEHGLLDLDSALGRPRAGTAIYCCGPEPLLRAVEERSATWPSGALHVERFKPDPERLEGPDEEFEVVLRRSGVLDL